MAFREVPLFNDDVVRRIVRLAINVFFLSIIVRFAILTRAIRQRLLRYGMKIPIRLQIETELNCPFESDGGWPARLHIPDTF